MCLHGDACVALVCTQFSRLLVLLLWCVTFHSNACAAHRPLPRPLLLAPPPAPHIVPCGVHVDMYARTHAHARTHRQHVPT